MEDTRAGLCGIYRRRVYPDGVLLHCTYHFGHGGKHSWENHPVYASWHERSPHAVDRDDGKLSVIKEARYLVDEEAEEVEEP